MARKKINSKDYIGNPMGFFSDKKRELKKAQVGPGTDEGAAIIPAPVDNTPVVDAPITRQDFKQQRMKNKMHKLQQKDVLNQFKREDKVADQLADDRSILDKVNQTIGTIGNAVGNVSGMMNPVRNVIGSSLGIGNQINAYKAANDANAINVAPESNVAPGMYTTNATTPANNAYNSNIKKPARSDFRGSTIIRKKGGKK